MKLIASALAAASALATVTYAEEIWTSHSDYQACANVMLGAELCTEKFYTVTPGVVLGNAVAETCASLNAFPWCPESEEESINVYANLAVLEYTRPDGNLDIVKWAAEGISKWTGVQLDPAFNGMSKQISNYVCPNPLETSDGVMTFFWNSEQLDEGIFTNENIREPERRCVAMGEQMQFKWGNLPCGEMTDTLPTQPKRAVCVTTDDMSGHSGYTEMNMEAAQDIRNELNQLMRALRNAALAFGFFLFFIFTGCCFCCCFCCCCKPCRSGDSAPVVTQTTQVQQQAAPAPQQYAAPPAPAPMMPAYAPPMQQPAFNPYAQPMMQPQQPMGGINLNISNNNTNSNK